MMRICSSYKAALTIYNKRLESRLAGISETANEVLQIDDRANHAKEVSIAHDRSTHEHGSALIFARADGERLSVIAAAFARGDEGMLQFALHKLVRDHASCGDSFSFIVEKGRVIDDVGRRSKSFNQGAQ